MDNAKARCWYEATLPLYGLADCTPQAYAELQAEVNLWLSGAEMAAMYLRNAVKDAWFSVDARGDFSHVDASFWSRTEHAFYRQLKQRLAAAQDDTPHDRLAAAEAWRKELGQAALTLFDTVIVGAGPVERQKPERAAKAMRQLRSNLAGPKLRTALGLPTDQKAARKTTRTSSATA
jgi:CRISPR system Cascade subunit CasA